MSTNQTSDKASFIARDLLASVAIINELLVKIDEDPMQAMRDQILIGKVTTEVTTLYAKICKYYDNSEDALDIAFAKVFSFPSRFKRPASLELIISFIYIMIRGYENMLSSPILTDHNQVMYAMKHETNQSKVADLIHDRK